MTRFTPHSFSKRTSMTLGLLTLALTLAISGAAQAFQVQPMSYVLEPSGEGSRQTLRIENSFRHAVAIEIEVSRRFMDESGQVSHEPAEEDFLVFPPQTRLEPGAIQAVRVQYIGDPALTETHAYTIAARQVPVRSPESDTATVQVVFNMGTAAYVRPRGARAELAPVEIIHSDDENQLIAVVHNRGNGHTNLHNALWSVRNGDGSEQTLDRETVQEMLNNPIIYPGHTRRIPLPAEVMGTGSDSTLSIRMSRHGA